MFRKHREMEERGLLDPFNETHLYALHMVFKPLLQEATSRFRQNWNMHKHSSLHHKSPQWAFEEGLRRIFEDAVGEQID